jgi:hypothetical protein
MQSIYFNNKNINEKKFNEDLLRVNRGESKFTNCKFRSTEMLIKSVKRCACQGGTHNISGYQCSKRDIFNVGPEVCTFCNVFESGNA